MTYYLHMKDGKKVPFMCSSLDTLDDDLVLMLAAEDGVIGDVDDVESITRGGTE